MRTSMEREDERILAASATQRWIEAAVEERVQKVGLGQNQKRSYTMSSEQNFNQVCPRLALAPG